MDLITLVQDRIDELRKELQRPDISKHYKQESLQRLEENIAFLEQLRQKKLENVSNAINTVRFGHGTMVQ